MRSEKEEEKTPYYIPNSIYAICDGLGDKEEWKEQKLYESALVKCLFMACSMGMHIPSKKIYSYIETKHDILFIKVVMSQFGIQRMKSSW